MVSHQSSEVAQAAERHVLGACLLHPEAVNDCADLRPADFYFPKHGMVFRAICASYADTGLTDPLSVAAALGRTPGALSEVGGHEMLIDLVEGVLTAAGVNHHAAIVKEQANRRRLESGIRLALERLREGASTEDVRTMIGRATEGPSSGSKPIARVRSYASFMQQDDFRFRMAGWLPMQGAGVLGGREHTGKSIVAVDLAHRCLFGDAIDAWCGHEVREPCSSVYIAAEDPQGLMLRSQGFIQERVGGAFADEFLRTGTVEGRTIEWVDRMPAGLADPVGIAEIERLIIDFEKRHKHRPGIIWLDTMATLYGGDENDNALMGVFAREIGRLADEYGLLIVLVHHLRKMGERQPKPSASDLRGSSSLAGNFDCVWMMWRKDDSNRLSPVEIYCAKGKNGGMTGTSHHLESRWVVLRTNDDGDSIGAPVLVSTDKPVAKTEAEIHAEVTGNIRRIAMRMLEALRDPSHPGWVPDQTTAELLTSGKLTDKRHAWKFLVTQEWVRNVGNSRDRRFEVTSKAPPTSPRPSSKEAVA